MSRYSDTMRVIAERYLQLAKTASDPQDRVKFLDYAFVYMELAERRASETHERQETWEPAHGD